MLKFFKRIGDAGEIKDKRQNLSMRRIKFKPQPNCFLYFFYEGQKLVVTNAFRENKKSYLKTKRKKH